jgi:hypothetical protein
MVTHSLADADGEVDDGRSWAKCTTFFPVVGTSGWTGATSSAIGAQLRRTGPR